jgi:hypothetical protein
MWSKARNVYRRLVKGGGSIGQAVCDSNRLGNGDGSPNQRDAGEGSEDHDCTAGACVSRQGGVTGAIYRALDQFMGPRGRLMPRALGPTAVKVWGKTAHVNC